jgi:hypothetical protein
LDVEFWGDNMGFPFKPEKRIRNGVQMRLIRIILVLFFLVVLSMPVSALQDNFQNHPGDDVSDLWVDSTIPYPGYPGSYFGNYTFNNDCKVLQFSSGASGLYSSCYNRHSEKIGYLSFVIPRSTEVCCAPDFRIRVYDQEGYLLATSVNLNSYLVTSAEYGEYHNHWEFLISGTTMSLYINGTYIGEVMSGITDDVYYFEIQRSDGGLSIDDLFTSGLGIVGSHAHDNPIIHNWDNPTASTEFFNSTYSWRYRAGGGSTYDPCTSLETIYSKTGEVINITTDLNTSTQSGLITYNVSDMFYGDTIEDEKYGVYWQKLKRNSTTVAIDWFMYDYDAADKPAGGTISFDKNSYVVGETAGVSHLISSPDFVNYNYEASVLHIETGSTIESWSIATTSGTHEVDLSSYSTGSYLVLLSSTTKDTGFEYDMDYDTATISEEVRVEGVTYNAETELVLPNVNISFLQGSVWYNTTSNATGCFNLTGMTPEIDTLINASLANYTHNNFTWTPLQNGFYEIDLYLLPSADNLTHNNTTICGLVTSYPVHQAISGATVHLWNGSWNGTDTTNTMGYYIFQNLTNGSYEINASATNYITSEDEAVDTNNGSVEYHYILLHGLYTITVNVKDASDSTTIQSFTGILDDTTTLSTTNGTLIFSNVEYGIHTLEFSSDGYEGSIQNTLVQEDVNLTVYLTPYSDAGTGIQYGATHQVEFIVVDIWGQPLTNISVSARGVQTTVGNQSWFEKIFGINPNVNIYTSSMNGTTDYAGHINFFMVETIKYGMWFNDTNTSTYKEIYPKDDRYVITIGEMPEQKIAYWITDQQNTTHGNITMHYSDYNIPVKTNWVNYSIYYLENDTLVYSHNFTTITQTQNNTSMDLNGSLSYLIKLRVNHDDFGEFTQYITIVFILPDTSRLPAAQGLIDNLEPWQVNLIGMGILTMFALIFGAVSSGIGGLVLAFMCYAFYFFGLLPLVSREAAVVIFPLILIVAVVNLISEQRGVVDA